MKDREAAAAVIHAAGTLKIKFMAGLRLRRSITVAAALDQKAMRKKTTPSLKRSFHREERPGVKRRPMVERTRTTRSTNMAVNALLESGNKELQVACSLYRYNKFKFKLLASPVEMRMQLCASGEKTERTMVMPDWSFHVRVIKGTKQFLITPYHGKVYPTGQEKG